MFSDNENTLNKMNQEILKSKLITENIPCNNCNGDCCGPVPFSPDEILNIFNKYLKVKSFKKRFPWKESDFHKNIIFTQFYPNDKTAVVATFKHKVSYRKNGLEPYSCIFKDNEATGGCIIYEDRPTICREYGNRECLKCPYTGLDKQPENLDERKRLVIEGHKYRQNQTLIEQGMILLNFKKSIVVH